MAPLLSASQLLDRVGDPNLRIVDVRFDLSNPDAGRARYQAGHLPGAVYLHLEDDLSGPLHARGLGGRHPLPDPDTFARTLARVGIGNEHDVVAYDDCGGAMAGRLWWLLHWIGRPSVSVLDGGIGAWAEAGGKLERAIPQPARAVSTADPDASMVVTCEIVQAAARRSDTVVVDVRAAERFRGETEPLDRKAGHVPGAINLPYVDSLTDGRFCPPQVLHRRLDAAAKADDVIVYCGSGVTAAHTALALVVAGRPMPRLYAGSWSDWSSRDELPVATGAAPTPHGPHPASE